jgi:transcriptional regulator with XRE-family HTH domain
MEFREFLRQRREQIEISQAELAESLSNRGQETSSTRISHWETGRNRPPLEDAIFRQALASSLEMDVNEMMSLLGFIRLDESRSKVALRAADIVEHLPPDAQDLAIDYLEVLERRFSQSGLART